MESVLNVTVSKYPKYCSPAIDCNLLDYLKNPIQELKATVDTIRSKETKAERDPLKKNLPGITPSAICYPTRSGENVKSHTGLMSFDVDNIPPELMSRLRNEIVSIPYVAYCGLSVSGRGFWGLVPISNPAKHLQQFDALEFLFKEYGIEQPMFDRSVQDISRFRFYSYDTNAYFNHNAQTFTYLYEAPVKAKKAFNQQAENSIENNPFNDFNQNGDIESLLTAHGWIYQPRSDKGTRRRYTRPGKDSGTSADWCTQRRILFIFTDATEFEPNKGINPVNAFCALEAGNDWGLCAKKLKALGFGTNNN